MTRIRREDVRYLDLCCLLDRKENRGPWNKFTVFVGSALSCFSNPWLCLALLCTPVVMFLCIAMGRGNVYVVSWDWGSGVVGGLFVGWALWCFSNPRLCLVMSPCIAMALGNVYVFSGDWGRGVVGGLAATMFPTNSATSADFIQSALTRFAQSSWIITWVVFVVHMVHMVGQQKKHLGAIIYVIFVFLGAYSLHTWEPCSPSMNTPRSLCIIDTKLCIPWVTQTWTVILYVFGCVFGYQVVKDNPKDMETYLVILLGFLLYTQFTPTQGSVKECPQGWKRYSQSDNSIFYVVYETRVCADGKGTFTGTEGQGLPDSLSEGDMGGEVEDGGKPTFSDNTRRSKDNSSESLRIVSYWENAYTIGLSLFRALRGKADGRETEEQSSQRATERKVNLGAFRK